MHASRPRIYPQCPCQLVSAFGYLSGCIEFSNSSTPFHEAMALAPFVLSRHPISTLLLRRGLLIFRCRPFFDFSLMLPLFGTLCSSAPFVVYHSVFILKKSCPLLSFCLRPFFGPVARLDTLPVLPLLPPPVLRFGDPAGVRPAFGT